MRRSLAIALVLLFWLPPVFALLPKADEAVLPACCRRHGAHHCMMANRNAWEAGPGHFFAASHHCPLFRSAARVTVPAFVSPATAPAQASLATRIHGLGSSSITLDASYASSGRGPPSLC